jgi:hypothetical protein
MAWSPDGTRLSYSIPRFDVVTPPDNYGSVDLHVLTIREGQPVSSEVFAGVAGGGWSPDGVHLGIVRDASPDQMGSGIRGVPAILDVATGGQLVLGSEPGWHQKAPSFNHDGSLFMVSGSTFNGNTYDPALVIYTTEGAEHDRIEFANDGTYGYASPQWAPDANRIAMHIYRNQGETYSSAYEVYDVATRSFSGNVAPPKTSDRIGGRCGGGDMWNTEWTIDGGRVLYSFMFGDTGANGIWSWDVASGQQRVIYAANASSPTAGPGNIVMFSSSSYPSAHIFYGSSEGGLPRVITDGSSPVWWVP